VEQWEPLVQWLERPNLARQPVHEPPAPVPVSV
jgi:hypothetical protein